MKDKKLVCLRVLLCALTAAMILFIFINSSLDAASSTVHSTGVREFINSLLHSLNIPIVFTEYFVRKCAHFAEYFVLGTLLFFTVKSFVSKLCSKIMLAPVLGLIVACVDETIQLFSAGRSGQFTDVLLDFGAVITAFVIFLFVSIHRGNRKRGENK